jgi:hypothetical protein
MAAICSRRPRNNTGKQRMLLSNMLYDYWKQNMNNATVTDLAYNHGMIELLLKFFDENPSFGINNERWTRPRAGKIQNYQVLI